MTLGSRLELFSASVRVKPFYHPRRGLSQSRTVRGGRFTRTPRAVKIVDMPRRRTYSRASPSYHIPLPNLQIEGEPFMEIKGQQRPLELPQFVRLAPTDAVSDLGPLAGLVGTWTGKQGWNLIAVPKPGDEDGFTLLVRPYYETITFTPLGVLVPDRGASEILNIYGLEYSLSVSDLLTNQPLHLENGMWLYAEDPQDPQSPTIVRQATVPHGNSVLALGNSQQAAGPPTIPEL